MKNVKKILFSMATTGVLSLSQNGFAGAGICSGPNCVAPSTNDASGPATRTDTRAYAGLSWELDGSNGFIPDFLIGVRSLSVNSYSQVSGADFNIRLRYKNEISFDSARLAYVGGTRAVMGNAGLGYSFSNTSVFATGAAQAAYSRLGADYMFNQESIKPYAEANSLYMPKSVAPNQGGNSCNSPYALTSTSSVSPFTGVNPSAVKNGQTCFVAPNG